MSLADSIQNWIDHLSLPREEFNGLPACPFAKAASWIIVNAFDEKTLRTAMLGVAYLAPKVVIIIALPDRMRAAAHRITREMQPLLGERDLIALVSDHQRRFQIEAFVTTQPQHLLVLVQRRNELIAGSRALDEQGYYDKWPQELLERIR